MTFFGVESPESLLPIAGELALASIFHLALLLNPWPRNNFFCSIAYSVFKIVGITSLFVSLNWVTDFIRVPLLIALLLNEVVLLVASIRTRQLFMSIRIRSMYTKSVLFLRIVGELLIIALLFGLAVGTQVFVCKCTLTNAEPPLVGRLHLNVARFQRCIFTDREQFIASMLIPQVRAIAFIITAVAFTVSVSGWQYMLMGFKNTIGHEKRDNLSAILSDDPWKRIVRSVYSYLNFFAVGLLLLTYLCPGFYQCAANVRTIGGVDKQRFVLTPSSHAYLNAILAISQMFMADVHVRLAAIKAVEDAARKENPNFKEAEVAGPVPDQWIPRAQSAMQRRKTLRRLAADDSMEP